MNNILYFAPYIAHAAGRPESAVTGRNFMPPLCILSGIQATPNIIYRKSLFFKMKYAINRKKRFLFDEKYKRNYKYSLYFITFFSENTENIGRKLGKYYGGKH